jgi:hypothetical protein
MSSSLAPRKWMSSSPADPKPHPGQSHCRRSRQRSPLGLCRQAWCRSACSRFRAGRSWKAWHFHVLLMSPGCGDRWRHQPLCRCTTNPTLTCPHPTTETDPQTRELLLPCIATSCMTTTQRWATRRGISGPLTALCSRPEKLANVATQEACMNPTSHMPHVSHTRTPFQRVPLIPGPLKLEIQHSQPHWM